MRNLWIVFLLAACTTSNLPDTAAMGELAALRLIQYRDGQGNGLIPVARNVGATRARLWQRWLHTHQASWQNETHTKLSGTTKWCAQWQHGETHERVCRRDDGLIWFGRGVLRDKTALAQAEKIWALKN